VCIIPRRLLRAVKNNQTEPPRTRAGVASVRATQARRGAQAGIIVMQQAAPGQAAGGRPIAAR
jgi:hypothetical protein